jgi:hypothetical protein
MRKLLEEPTATLGDRGEDEKTDDLIVSLGDEDASIEEAAEGVGVHEEAERRQAFGRQPAFQAVLQVGIFVGLSGRPLRHPDRLVSGAMQLGAERGMLRDDLFPTARIPDRLGTE